MLVFLGSATNHCSVSNPYIWFAWCLLLLYFLLIFFLIWSLPVSSIHNAGQLLGNQFFFSYWDYVCSHRYLPMLSVCCIKHPTCLLLKLEMVDITVDLTWLLYTETQRLLVGTFTFMHSLSFCIKFKRPFCSRQLLTVLNRKVFWQIVLSHRGLNKMAAILSATFLDKLTW